MNFFLVLAIVLSIIVLYIGYSSYRVQMLIRRVKTKKSFIDIFSPQVKGMYFAKGYFAVSHHVITKQEYKAMGNRNRVHFSECYNVLKFQTQDANWELFFHLIREGVSYSELMTLRVFPKHLKIKSEGNIEKNYSRLNTFTNNRYLNQVVEEDECVDLLKWLIRHNGDILLIFHNNLHYKAFIRGKGMTPSRAMDMVKALNGVKSKIYRKGILEY